MAIKQVSTGTAAILFLEAYEVDYDAISNTREISWSLYLRENGGSNQAWNGGGISAFVDGTINGGYVGNIWAGSFGFDFRPGGNQTKVIATGSTVFGSNPDGTGSVQLGGHIGYTGTSTAGGPTDVYLNVPVTTLKRLPNVPSGVAAVRNSDTQVTVSWNNSGASNGQATQNKIQASKNGGAWYDVVTIGASGSTVIGTAANQKLQFRVAAGNEAGWTGYSGASAAVYTTPGAPSSVAATKNAGLDIVVTFTENVDYSEHTHEVWHGTVTGGVTTWDGSALATLASGVTTYTHVTPNAAQVHVYRVRARAGALASGYAQSDTVQLQTAPNKPTMSPVPAFADRIVQPAFGWIHNPVDTSPQTAYELRYSTNGGTTWTSTNKVVSTASTRTIATTFAANTALQVQVRTWGSATTGGSEGTGASPWSDTTTQTYKSLPVASVVSPTNAQVVNEATLRTTLGFSQAEAATFVRAELELLSGATLLETLESANLVGITFDTPGQNGTSYTIRARMQDSNGLWSAWVTRNFSVAYLPPVPAAAVVSYLPDTGWGQIDLSIPAPGGGQSAATTVTIVRTIDGVAETVVQDYPVSAVLTFLDTVPTIHGTNVYTITTKSALGAQAVTTINLVTEECRRAYLSKGPGFNTVTVFGANLDASIVTGVASATIQAAGRVKPIGLYGVETSVQLKVKSFIFPRTGFSTLKQLEAILLLPGKACYRDATGRRTFGSVKGSVEYSKTDKGDFNFTITETS